MTAMTRARACCMAWRGLLMEPAAQHFVAEQLPKSDASVFKSLFPEAISHYNREGVTSTHDAAIGIHGQGMGTVRAYRELEEENRLNIRVYLTTMYPVYDQLIELGLGHGFGSDLLKIGSVKMFQDGSIQALTAALSEDYYNKPGFHERCREYAKKNNNIQIKLVATK